MAEIARESQTKLTLSRKRNAWVAVLLAVILSPFLSMLYLGKLRRGFAYLILTAVAIVAPPFLASAGFWPRVADMSLLALAVRLVGAVDSYRIARRSSQSFSGPWYSRWYGVSGAFLLVAAVILSVRSFIIEPFRIPSSTMMPTLLVGDYILVNKFTYGVRLPVVNTKVISTGKPQHGDVMVFKYPDDPSLDYVKRVIGLPGDRVEYRNKRLTINGKLLDVERMDNFELPNETLRYARAWRFRERLGTHSHSLLINPDELPIRLDSVRRFPFRERCEYKPSGFICTVPNAHYFVMGDNRDSSSDSRYWGFVPEDYIVGRAFIIWWNDDEPERAGISI